MSQYPFVSFILILFFYPNPADVLALRSGREGLGADDGVAPHEGVLLVDVRPAVLGSNHRVVGRQGVVHARLLVHLDGAHGEIHQGRMTAEAFFYV